MVLVRYHISTPCARSPQNGADFLIMFALAASNKNFENNIDHIKINATAYRPYVQDNRQQKATERERK